MVNTFGASKNALSQAQLPHQERVNVEMFKAIEMLGKKLERAEGERDRLQRRLALIESAATVDERTGKLYLPVVVDPATAPQFTGTGAPKWTAAASLMSSALALLAIGIVLFREPTQSLTSQQLAALNALASPQIAKFENKTWKTIRPAEEETETAAAAIKDDPWARSPLTNIDSEELPKDLPDDDMLALEENNADAPEPVKVAVKMIKAVETPPVEELEPASGAAEEAFISGEDKTAEKAPEIKPEIKKEKPVEIAAAPAVVEALPPIPPPPPLKAVKVESGEDGIGPDPALPSKLAQLEKRAFDGIPEAQHDLATLYASGKMVAQDYKRSAYWFSKAADGGVGNAHYNLGVMFQQGLGVKQDMKKAIGWYEKAAELGHPEAMYNLGIAFIEGVGTDRNVDRGVSFFKRAANAGVAQAAYNLGVLYESNFIGSIDLQKALDWYEVAANEHHADAEAAIERIKNQMGGVSDQALTLADMVEPSSGEAEEEGLGEGDASLPGDETTEQDNVTGKIQKALIKQGFLPGKPSGRLDTLTEDAIRAWQKQQGLKIDGIPTQELLEKMEKISGKN